jgi:hypothetical protein
MNGRSLLLLLLLGACASPVTVYKPVTVEVPVPCDMPKVDHPAWATSLVPLNSRLFDKVKASLVELQQRAAYEARLQAAAASCAKAST